MSIPKRKFWSSIPGVVTGVAGVVGAVVGLITVLITLGVIGGSNSSPTVTTLAPSGSSGAPSDSGSGTSGSGGATVSTAAKGSFTVDPNALTFGLAKPKATVTVFNDGSVPLKMNTPVVSGTDQDKFAVSSSGCSSSLPAKKSCSIEVTFAGGLSATATMKVSADNAPDTAAVKLTGSF